MATTRRRGDELHRAILAAVMAELAEHGYSGVTFEGVAVRAETSKTVLYRRWPHRSGMVLAAILTGIRHASLTLPDTGDLAGDLTALLTAMNRSFGSATRGTVLGLLAELGEDAAAGFQESLLDLGRQVITAAVDRARTRGELGGSELPGQILSLPADLARHDLLIQAHLTDERITTIVHQIAIPLFTAHSFAVHSHTPEGDRS